MKNLDGIPELDAARMSVGILASALRSVAGKDEETAAWVREGLQKALVRLEALEQQEAAA